MDRFPDRFRWLFGAVLVALLAASGGCGSRTASQTTYEVRLGLVAQQQLINETGRATAQLLDRDVISSRDGERVLDGIDTALASVAAARSLARDAPSAVVCIGGDRSGEPCLGACVDADASRDCKAWCKDAGGKCEPSAEVAARAVGTVIRTIQAELERYGSAGKAVVQ